MFKDTPDGQTHSHNDGCGMPEHNDPMVEKEIKKGDYIWVKALTNAWLAIAKTDPFLDGEHILASRREVVLVRTKDGSLWNAPTHLCTKMDDLDEEVKKEALT